MGKGALLPNIRDERKTNNKNTHSLSRRQILQIATSLGVGSVFGLAGTGTTGASHAENYVYSGGSDDELHKLTPDGNTEWEYTGHSNTVYSMAVDADGYIYTGDADYRIHKLSPEGDRQWTYFGHGGLIQDIAVDADGNMYSCSTDEEIHKLDPDRNKQWEYTDHTDWVTAVTVDTDGYVYSASRTPEIHKISPDGNTVWRYTDHSAWASAIAVDPDGYVYSGAQDYEVHKISPDGEPVWQYTDHNNVVRGVAVDGDGYVYSGAGEEIHKTTPDGDPEWQHTEQSGTVWDIAVDAEGYIYSATSDDVHKLSPGGDSRWQYTGHDDLIYTVAVDNAYTAAFGFPEHNIDHSGPGDDSGEGDSDGFVVDITETNAPVGAGDILEVTTQVENTGDAEDTQEITLDVNAQQEDSQTVTLNSGESTGVALEWTATGRNAAGIRVASADDADNELVRLDGEDEDPAFFAVDIVGANTPVSEGEELGLTANVENTGSQEATQTISLDVNGQEVDTTDVTLTGGDSTQVDLGWQADRTSAVGVRLASADDWDNDLVMLSNTNFLSSGL